MLGENDTCVMSYSILIMLEYIMKKIRNKFLFFLPDGIILISYPEKMEDWTANTPKMAANVGNNFELENFSPTVANKSELEVCLYLSPIDKTCQFFFSSEVFNWQSKNMEKLGPNRAQLFLRNKYALTI